MKASLFLKPSDGFSSNLSIEQLPNGIFTSRDAVALYGPYIDLPAGVWHITVNGDIDCGSSGCFFDVCSDSGSITLLKAELENANGAIYDGQLDARFPLHRIEFRIAVTANSYVRVTSIELTREEPNLKRYLDSLDDGGRRFDVYDRLGLRLILDQECVVDREVVNNGGWEEDRFIYLKELISSSNISERKRMFLDIGAYFGLYAMRMARTNFFDEIIVFEPDPLNYRQLMGNLLLNDPNCYIKTNHFALSDKDGEAYFYPSTEHPSGNRGGVGLVPGRSEWPNSIIVKTCALDSLIQPQNQIIFAKIDTEGHEFQVINGMLKLLASNHCVLQIECIGQGQFEAVNNLMIANGYKLINRIPPDYYYSNFLEYE